MQNQLLKDIVSYKLKRHITTQWNEINIKSKHKCSYILIPMALKEFGECFKLAVSKEVMPYNIYTWTFK